MYVKSPLSMNSSHSLSLPIKLFAQLPPLKDHPRIAHHKVISVFGYVSKFINNNYKRFEINNKNKYVDVLSFLPRIILIIEDNKH